MSTIISYQLSTQLRTPLTDLPHLDTATANRDIGEKQPSPPVSCKSPTATADQGIGEKQTWSPVSSNRPKSVCRHTVEELTPHPYLQKKPALLLGESEENRPSKVLMRLSSRYARRRSSNSETLAWQLQAARDSLNELKKLQEENEFRHVLAVQEGRDFLYHFARTHFESHMDHISITNTKSIGEIKMIGNEELSVGVRQCRRLFNAPVISDDMGLLLWQELRQGDALDHSHEEATAGAAAGVATEEFRRQRTADFEERKAAWQEYRQSRAEQDTEVCESLRSRYGYNKPVDAEAQLTKIQQGSLADRPPRAKKAYAPGSLPPPMERRALDDFLNEVKKRTTRSAGLLAASLAASYQHL